MLAHGILDHPWVAQTLLMGTVGLQAFNTAGYGPATLQYHLPARCHDDGPPNRGDYATGLILDLTNQDWSVVVAVNA